MYVHMLVHATACRCMPVFSFFCVPLSTESCPWPSDQYFDFIIVKAADVTSYLWYKIEVVEGISEMVGNCVLISNQKFMKHKSATNTANF